MKQLKRSQLEELTGMLEKEREELESHFAAEGGVETRGTMTDSTGELSSYDNHPADLATETFERERDMAIDDSMEAKLEKVIAALGRIADGSYGICEVCGTAIPFERLQAAPETTVCIEHAQETDGAEYRPVEEQVMTPPPSGAGSNRQNDSGRFDNAGAWEEVESYGNSDDTVQQNDRQEPPKI